MAYVGNCTDCNRMWTWGDGKETICPTCAKIRQLTRERDEALTELQTCKRDLSDSTAQLESDNELIVKLKAEVERFRLELDAAWKRGLCDHPAVMVPTEVIRNAAKIEVLEEVFGTRFQNVNRAWIISAHGVECMIGKLKAKQGEREDGS